ncbi:hypothetical protein K2173_025141 [Erythroxylum novogranatense]|uniref:Transcription termination factor MTEF18, mitochondrial-like n=1 Tax=Erythroxylum novogranatense TaxID=1862640 RepID=A0AAV8SX00_9ROSI|nr:hypothetical protein K2173_025141 [Erythroxylum novogranatense]
MPFVKASTLSLYRSYLDNLVMNHLQKLRKSSILNRFSSFLLNSRETPLLSIKSSFYTGKKLRFLSTEVINQTVAYVLDRNSIVNGERTRRIPVATRREAQAALLDYLHCTRCLQFIDAENMSKNAPHFLEKLLENVDTEVDVGNSVTRFLRYHPINEFEPFFESLGLKPCEYNHLLSRDLMFLSDDDLLLHNCHVLYNYGIPRDRIGKIFKKAMEIFRYDHGELELKLQAYEELGLTQSFVAELVVCSPYLLVGGVNADFIKVMEILREGGITFSWMVEHLDNKIFYNWSQLLTLLNLFESTGFSRRQLGVLIDQHPGILWEASGNRALILISFLLKFGSTMNRICSLFPQIPQMPIAEFVLNMRHCLLFLNEIEMEANDIGKIICSHPLLLGSCRLKKSNTVLNNVNVGKMRLCGIIKENPPELKKWVIGSKVERLPRSGMVLRSKMLKTKFLLGLGFTENSEKMEKAFRLFRGKGTELQERFDCLVKSGLDRKDVCELLKTCPQILNQSKDVLEMKIDFLVNVLGYPISTLVEFPSYLSYTVERVKLRVAMYNWLRDEGTKYSMALSSVVACSDKLFLKKFVKPHPRGFEVWQNMKRKVHSE